jgi:Na+/H+-dicarboxylate symporter
MSAIEANGAPSEISPARSAAATQVPLQVLIAVALGAIYPEFSVALKPYGDAFVRAIRVVVAPIILTTIVVGIAKMGDIRRVAHVGVKALV